MNIPAKPKKRLSLQVCRVMAIFEVLHRLRGATSEEVFASVSSVLPKAVCRRTISRDLQAMIAMGFVEVETIRAMRKNTKLLPTNRYHLSTPVTLREKIGLVESERNQRKLK